MANQDGTLDITEAVEAGRSTFAAWAIGFFYAKVALIPAIGPFLVKVFEALDIGEWIFGDLSKEAVVGGMIENTILRKPAQAVELVTAVHHLKNLPEDVSDEIYEAAERNRGQYFKNLVRVTN